jgi:AcrR family transcriptional regulator
MTVREGRAGARTRLRPEERTAQIVEEAARFFAERGFDGRTRDLAARLGVTQALLYRYFPSKQVLVDRVFEQVFASRWDPAWERLLADRAEPLLARLTRFYQAYAARSTYTSLRLFVRAGLDGVGFARRYSVPLTARILQPVVRELRHEAGLPGFGSRPFFRAERELAMMLHGGIVFLGIRRHVYGMLLADAPDDLVALHVRTFLRGAVAEIRRLHAEPPAPGGGPSASRRGRTSRR